MGGDPAGHAARGLAGDPRRRRQRRDGGGSARTTCSASTGSSRSCWARSPRRPTPPRCSPCCDGCRCRARSPARSRPSRGSTTPRPCCWSRWSAPEPPSTTAILGFSGIVVYELVTGVVVGLGIGFGGAWVMRRVALPSSGLYPLAVLSLTILAYAGTAALHASGFAAVYVAALVLGNSELPHRAATRSFSEGVAWLAQIGLFVMLGLLVSPETISLRHVVHRRAGRPAADVRGQTAVGAGLLLRPPALGPRAGVRVLGGAARRGADRARDDPAGRAGRRVPRSCSTSSS